jgi:hypothetical protein
MSSDSCTHTADTVALEVAPCLTADDTALAALDTACAALDTAWPAAAPARTAAAFADDRCGWLSACGGCGSRYDGLSWFANECNPCGFCSL